MKEPCSSPTALQAQELVFRWKRGDKPILDALSFELPKGALTVLVGPNGAGKSTLLKILTGEIRPESGSVLVAGKPLGDWPQAELSRVRGVLPQESTLQFDFRVHEVVMLGRMPHLQGAETARDGEIVREALAAVDMTGFSDRLYPTLSGGEKQRVQLARVLAQIWEPCGPVRCLFLDEPTSSLDLAHQHATLALARTLAGKGAAVFAILHDLNLAAAYADRILMLHRGVVAAAGSPWETLTPGNIQSVFNVAAHVQPHPLLPCPLVSTLPK